MERNGQAESTPKQRQQRRGQSRYAILEGASLLLLKHGTTMSCQILDLSLGGCRICTAERFLAGVMVRVEVEFKVLGIAFRLSGVTQWTNRDHLAGIRFIDMTPRRTDALAELLAEVGADQAAKAAGQAAQVPAPPRPAGDNPPEARQSTDTQNQPKPAETRAASPPPAQPLAARGPARPEAPARPEPVPPKPIPSAPGPAPAMAAPQQAAAASKRVASGGSAPAVPEAAIARRAQPRHPVDTSAVIHLIDLAAVARGRILDLSPGGCCIHTDQRFPVGIFRRVETEFRIEGLPFRLGGVTQALYDKQTVGIRFLDMSDRKREQVVQMIEEIEELRQRERAAPSEGAPPWSDEAGEPSRRWDVNRP
ncbi:MAG: PilZ domain-containing protein [Terracidiphilus sp.]